MLPGAMHPSRREPQDGCKWYIDADTEVYEAAVWKAPDHAIALNV